MTNWSFCVGILLKCCCKCMRSIRGQLPTWIVTPWLYIHESRMVFERYWIMYLRTMSIYLSLAHSSRKKRKKLFVWQPAHFDIHSVALRRWNKPLCGEYTVLLDVSPKFSGDLKPYFYSFSCYGYLWRGSWLEATINSVPSSLWQTCLWLMMSVRTSHDYTCVDEIACVYAQTQIQCCCLRGDSGTDTSVISPSVVQCHCQFVMKSRSSGECVKSILGLFKEQPATTVW